MEREMTLPRYYELVRFVAQLGAVLGCMAGIVAILGSLAAFQLGFMAGMTAIFGGVITIILSLAGLGIAYCFLALVKAQIETRNAIVKYTLFRQED